MKTNVVYHSRGSIMKDAHGASPICFQERKTNMGTRLLVLIAKDAHSASPICFQQPKTDIARNLPILIAKNVRVESSNGTSRQRQTLRRSRASIIRNAHGASPICFQQTKPNAVPHLEILIAKDVRGKTSNASSI